MNNRARLAILIPSIALLLPSLVPANAAETKEAGPRQEDVRAAVERSLPFIEEKGVAWIQERGCVTCHQTTFLIWTHNEAARRGFPVDRRKVNEWTNWALLHASSLSDSPRDTVGDNNGPEALSQFLLGRDPASPWLDKPPKWHGRLADPYENVVKHLLKAQTPEGRWLPGGQSRNPDEIPTAWAVLALASREDFMNATGPGAEARKIIQPALKRLVASNNEPLPKARDTALAWLRTIKPDDPGALNEQVVLRLLIASKFGKLEDADERSKTLLALQNPDGGWSADPKLHQPSDAFATGQSLYALKLTGLGGDTTPVQRACGFLLSTQRADGSWPVLTTAFHSSIGNKDRDARTDEVYTYWGTAWATLGLLECLPETQPGRSPKSK